MKSKRKGTQVKKEATWEIKDRTYILKGGLAPLTYRLQGRSNTRSPLLWFDEEKGYNRELRYGK